MTAIHGDRAAVHEPAALTVDTSAYAAGDLIGKHAGGKLVFADAAGGAGRGGRLVQVILADAAAQKAAIDLVLFSDDPVNTTFTDNAALDIADADLGKIVAVLPLAAASYKDFADNSVICAPAGPLAFISGDGNLYGALVSRGTPTYATGTDLSLRLVTEPDSRA